MPHSRGIIVRRVVWSAVMVVVQFVRIIVTKAMKLNTEELAAGFFVIVVTVIMAKSVR